ncbi:MAG: hypothetical protein IID46_03665 [Planctomycetes bacterium]|nr:hypothetical protein [Planctomycetota bacterium]
MGSMMKAQVFYAKEDMRLEDRPVPTIADDEVLVAVKAVVKTVAVAVVLEVAKVEQYRRISRA